MFTQLIRFNKEDSPAKVEEMFYKWASTFYTEKGFNGFAFINNEEILVNIVL